MSSQQPSTSKEEFVPLAKTKSMVSHVHFTENAPDPVDDAEAETTNLLNLSQNDKEIVENALKEEQETREEVFCLFKNIF